MKNVFWLLCVIIVIQHSCNNVTPIQDQAAERIVLTDDLNDEAITVEIDLGVIDNLSETTRNIPVKNETSEKIRLVPTNVTPKNI